MKMELGSQRRALTQYHLKSIIDPNRRVIKRKE